MGLPTDRDLFEVLDATWSPKALHTYKGWLIRDGAGGGQRVSAATLLPGAHNAQISTAASKMNSLGQNPLFMIRNSDTKLDSTLNASGYYVHDPVVILTAKTDKLIRIQPKQTHDIKTVSGPNPDAANIWAKGGIGQKRLDIMARVKGPKTYLSANNMGIAFAASHNNIAMVHAVEVAAEHRRKGVANALMYAASEWAKVQNCEWLAVLTVKENLPARTLYEGLGMIEVAAYHYRKKSSE